MERRQGNESAAMPCFDDIEENNLTFSQINNINEKMENLSIKEKKPEKLILKPRDYQQTIFNKAKNQNSIIYVETGKGKTFISIMLMANFLGIDINNPSSSNKKKNRQKQKNNIFCL